MEKCAIASYYTIAQSLIASSGCIYIFLILKNLSATLPSPTSTETKAICLHLKGRTLNARPEFSSEAEKLLSRAVKLKPSLSDAWNELGESYFKRRDIDAAKTCFQGALEHVSGSVLAQFD